MDQAGATTRPAYPGSETRVSTPDSDTVLITPASAESDELDERRAGYDAFMTRELPLGVRTELSSLGGRPALELIPASVHDEQARLLYLHGGAFVLGSPAGYAGFTAQFAHRAAIRTVSLDYRLAPEHPFPPPSRTVWPRIGICSTAALPRTRSCWSATPPEETWCWPPCSRLAGTVCR
jgi:acetyl esterase/lipase